MECWLLHMVGVSTVQLCFIALTTVMDSRIINVD